MNPDKTKDEQICQYLISSVMIPKDSESEDRLYMEAALALRHHGNPQVALRVIREETEALLLGSSDLPESSQYSVLNLLQNYLSYLAERQSTDAVSVAEQWVNPDSQH